MALQSERSQATPAPDVAPETGRGRGKDRTGGAGNAATAQRLSAGGDGDPKGGGTYVIRRGDTLSKIAKRAYGDGTKWREIMQANPKKVFRGGDLILVGDTLEIPALDLTPTTSPGPTGPGPTGPGPTGPGPTTAGPTTTGPTTAGPTTAGPTTSGPVVEEPPAVEPRGECTEYGDFLVYPDEYKGELPKGDPGVTVVREADYPRIVAERKAEAEAKREATISEVDDLLSYGAFDWAITDSDATSALNKLAALPASQLKVAVGRVNISRLLDNLPASERKSANFAKVVVCLSAEKMKPYLQDLLSYGVFDWAVTDGDVQAVVDLVTKLGPAEQRALLQSLDKPFLTRIGTNLGSGVKVSNESLKLIFDAMPDADVEGLKGVIGRRFNLDFSSNWFTRWQMDVKQDWDAAGLRRIWTLLEQLPPDAVQNSETLDLMLRQSTVDGSGVYYGGHDGAVVSYSDVNKTGGYGQILVDDGAGGKKDVALNSNINTFNTVVRHEVGHSVDAAIGASKEGGYVRTQANAGKWETYSSASAFVDAIIAAGGGMSSHGYADASKYEEAMRKAVKDEIDFADALKKVDASLAPPAANVGGPVAAVFETKRWASSKNPWYDSPERPAVGNRQWHQPYGSGGYASFLKDARPQFGVSAYQFRAPGEWFAEAYAAYYSDHDYAGDHPVGTRLRTRDRATAEWFDANVDKGHSLAKMTGQAEKPDNGGTGTTDTGAPGGRTPGPAPGGAPGTK